MSNPPVNKTDRMGDIKRFQLDALPNRIAALDLYQTHVEVKRFEFDKAKKVDMDKAKKALNSTMSSAVFRAKDRTDDYEFMQESGQFQTACGDIMVYAAVTRTV